MSDCRHIFMWFILQKYIHGFYILESVICVKPWLPVLFAGQFLTLFSVFKAESRAWLSSQHIWLFALSQPGLGVAFTLYLTGWRTTPNLPSRLGRGWPGGTERVKRCRIQDRKRKSSILARASPKHTLIPVPKGR